MGHHTISYKHYDGEHYKPAHAGLFPVHGNSPVWATIKRDEDGKCCMCIGHLGEEDCVELTASTAEEVKEILHTMHTMVHTFEEEMKAWENKHSTK